MWTQITLDPRTVFLCFPTAFKNLYLRFSFAEVRAAHQSLQWTGRVGACWPEQARGTGHIRCESDLIVFPENCAWNPRVVCAGPHRERGVRSLVLSDAENCPLCHFSASGYAVHVRAPTVPFEQGPVCESGICSIASDPSRRRGDLTQQTPHTHTHTHTHTHKQHSTAAVQHTYTYTHTHTHHSILGETPWSLDPRELPSDPKPGVCSS